MCEFLILNYLLPPKRPLFEMHLFHGDGIVFFLEHARIASRDGVLLWHLSVGINPSKIQNNELGSYPDDASVKLNRQAINLWFIRLLAADMDEVKSLLPINCFFPR